MFGITIRGAHNLNMVMNTQDHNNLKIHGSYHALLRNDGGQFNENSKLAYVKISVVKNLLSRNGLASSILARATIN